jgi:hypothetical protein
MLYPDFSAGIDAGLVSVPNLYKIGYSKYTQRINQYIREEGITYIPIMVVVENVKLYGNPLNESSQ